MPIPLDDLVNGHLRLKGVVAPVVAEIGTSSGQLTLSEGLWRIVGSIDFAWLVGSNPTAVANTSHLQGAWMEMVLSIEGTTSVKLAVISFDGVSTGRISATKLGVNG